MSYLLDAGTSCRPRFETLEEANKVANEVLKETGYVLGVFEDKRPATYESKEVEI